MYHQRGNLTGFPDSADLTAATESSRLLTPSDMGVSGGRSLITASMKPVSKTVIFSSSLGQTNPPSCHKCIWRWLRLVDGHKSASLSVDEID